MWSWLAIMTNELIFKMCSWVSKWVSSYATYNISLLLVYPHSLVISLNAVALAPLYWFQCCKDVLIAFSLWFLFHCDINWYNGIFEMMPLCLDVNFQWSNELVFHLQSIVKLLFHLQSIVKLLFYLPSIVKSVACQIMLKVTLR